MKLQVKRTFDRRGARAEGSQPAPLLLLTRFVALKPPKFTHTSTRRGYDLRDSFLEPLAFPLSAIIKQSIKIKSILNIEVKAIRGP